MTHITTPSDAYTQPMIGRRFHRIRHVAIAAFAFGFLLATSRPASAQTHPPHASRFEFRINSGALVPTGDQRSVLKDAQLTAVQVAWLVSRTVAVTGTFGWGRSRDIATVNAPKLDVFAADLGGEVRGPEWFAEHKVTFSPFAGLGAGSRSYNYRNLDVDAAHNMSGYVSVGGEIGVGRLGLRIEIRDYVSGFRPLVGEGGSATRNDVMFMTGLRFNRRRA